MAGGQPRGSRRQIYELCPHAKRAAVVNTGEGPRWGHRRLPRTPTQRCRDPRSVRGCAPRGPPRGFVITITTLSPAQRYTQSRFTHFFPPVPKRRSYFERCVLFSESLHALSSPPLPFPNVAPRFIHSRPGSPSKPTRFPRPEAGGRERTCGGRAGPPRGLPPSPGREMPQLSSISARSSPGA